MREFKETSTHHIENMTQESKWTSLADGSIYIETRNFGKTTMQILDKDEAISLMTWLSEVTK